MNTLEILITFVLVGVSQQQKPVPPRVVEFWNHHIAPYLDECIAESGVDPKLADRMIRYKEFPIDRDLGCYLKCVGRPAHLNFMSAEGELMVDNLVSTVGAPNELVQHCEKLQGKDLCETALFYANCAYGLLVDFQESNEYSNDLF